MSAVIKLAGTTITGVPVPPVDSILTNGSVLLIDPAHPVTPWAAGVPANAASITNIAGPISDTTFSISNDTVTFANSFASSAEGIVERSVKGGLHVINSQTSGVSKHGISIAMLTALKNYLAANPTHVIYMSLWGKTTRAPSTTGGELRLTRLSDGSLFWVGNGFTTSSNLANGSPTSSDARRLGITSSYSGSDYFSAITANGTPTSWGTLSTTFLSLSPNASAEVNKRESFIFQRMYMEDLTISGRAHADVAAIDKSLFDVAHAAGGRYYQDTYVTNPTTVP